MTKEISKPVSAAQHRMTGAERRQQILETATTVFSEKGFSGATTKEIACRAQINEALIFRHFSGKDALYDAILEERAGENRFAESWRNIKAIAEAKDDFRVFTNAGEFIVERKTSERDFLRVVIYGILEQRASVGHLLEEHLRPIRDFLVGYIHQRQADGAFRHIEALPSVNAFIGMTMHHMMTGEMLCGGYHGKADMDAIETFARITLAYLRSDGSTERTQN